MLCTFVGTASAIIYVDASNVGDPIEDGTIDHPFDKIQEGIDAASPGETVQVAASTYYENVLLTTDGITLLGSGADVTTIDGGGTGDAISNCNDSFDCIGISGFVIDGFTIKSYNTHAIHFYSTTTTSGIIKNNIIKDSAYGISAYRNCNLEITNNLIYNNRNSANTDGVGVSIMWNTPYGVSSTICGNTIVDNYHGIWVYNANAAIINNIVVNNSGGQNIESTGIDHHGGGTIDISYNDVFGNDVNYRGDASPGLGDISADPLFEDVASRDYHLSIGSPCVDAGTNEGAPSTDFDGNPRPIDGDGDGITIVDMGAFEYNPESMTVKVNINPDTLNLQSNGEWITAYIELPEDYDVVDIDVSTILLENTVSAEANPTEIGDYDDDGIPDLMVKFDRSVVQDILEVRDEVEITVTGEVAGTQFGGSDTIRVIDKGKGK